MPRLSHTLDLSPLDREDLRRTVDGFHQVLRGFRFDEKSYLLGLSEEEMERLERRAVELGAVDAELHRERRERAEAQGPEPRQEPEPLTRLRLLSGAHLAPGSRYLLNELAPGEPALDEQVTAAEEYEGWLGTDITVDSWSEAGVCAIGFAMRDVPDRQTEGAEGEPPPSTSGHLEHDRGAEVLTLTATLRFPASSAFVRWGSRLLTVGITARVDLPGWYASLNGSAGAGTTDGTAGTDSAAGAAPVRLEVDHPLARARAEVRPQLNARRRWSVNAALDVRGKGLSRPIVAAAAWALRRSLRRSEDWSLAEQVAEVESSWEEIARGLHAFPALLDEVAEAMEQAGAPRGPGPGSSPTP